MWLGPYKAKLLFGFSPEVANSAKPLHYTLHERYTIGPLGGGGPLALVRIRH
ncbi:hypothetical protein SAMN04489740_2030 [Arthrobacter alpinus]|uniref:Uncharacterized protein n=1 Tax=Arthrobacter alpinus TaxID=656366 RepID=A0A1H5KJI5_9MICC|nr:hypothetical protein SAMN04489740_2030 [Arthrobacter alpinus]